MVSGTRTQQKESEEQLSKHLIVNHLATLGPCTAFGDVTEVKILKRIASWVKPPYRLGRGWYFAWYHNCDIDDPLTVLVPVGAPRSSALLNHKNVSFISTGMNCACDVSTLFGIFLTIGTCLYITKRLRNIDLLLNVLQLWTLHGLLNPLHHCDVPLRQDKDVGDLVDWLLIL